MGWKALGWTAGVLRSRKITPIAKAIPPGLRHLAARAKTIYLRAS